MTASLTQRLFNSGKNRPCPVCRREKNGSCRICSDGQLVLCHYGATHRPPDGLTAGAVIAGADGQRWAYTGDSSDGRVACFTVHKPLPDDTLHSSKVILFPPRPRQPEPPLAPPAALPAAPQAPIQLLRLPGAPADLVQINPDGPSKPAKQPEFIVEASYKYTPTQVVWRLMPVDGGKKQFRPAHSDGRGFDLGPGHDRWPLWRQLEAEAAAKANPGCWLLELEGEKCAEIAREGGLAAISQPGHAHTVEQIQPRYTALKAAGVAGVVLLADRDQHGVKRAQQALDAAAAADLSLVVLPAAEVWQPLPDGGSIDDATGTPADRVAALIREVDKIKPGEWSGIWKDFQQQLGLDAPVQQEVAEAPKSYGELVGAALKAIRAGDEDDEMAARAELKTRYRISDDQINTALFNRHSADKVKAIAQAYDSVRLADVEQLEYLIDGWAPRGDLALLYGSYGTGKTTLAMAKLYAHATGQNLLDRDTPSPPGRGLFIATDSGAAALKKAMRDLGIDAESDPLLEPGNPEQRIWIWAHEPKQGHKAWICSIHDVIRLEEFIKAKGITYVVIDSAKAVSSPAGWSYTSNESVKALLQYLREGIAQPTGCCIEFLSHDGTASGSHSGAKAWAEDPSMVCALEVATDDNGNRVGITARFRKDRAAAVDPCRAITFSLQEGQLVLKQGIEVVGSCADALLTLLWEAHQQGIESLSGSELKDKALARFSRTAKTVENTWPRIAGSGKGQNPTPVIRPRRGQYALTPAEIQRRAASSPSSSSYRALYSEGGEVIRPIALEGEWIPPIKPPTGETGGLSFPRQPPSGEGIGGTQIAAPSLDLGQSPPDEERAPPPKWLPQLLELRAEFPDAAPYNLALKLEYRGIRTTGRAIRDVLTRIDADAQLPAVEES
jgi:hypothetical protein